MKKSILKREAVTKQQLIKDFARMGICKKDHLAVTLSLKKVGYVEGGPEAFIDALLEVVGPEGTIMMNTFTDSFPIYAIDDSFVYDSKLTSSRTGIVPETLRKRKEAIRSNSPSSSMTAIGKKATYLTQNHLNDCQYVPYSRLARINGKYLAIGLGNRLVAIRHQAQHQAGLLQLVKRPVAVKYRDQKGKIKLFACNKAPCTKTLGELTSTMKNMGILYTGKIGNAQSSVAPAKEILDFLSDILRKNPALNLCDSRFCLWCREVERRLGLYKKVKTPRYFQKYKIIQRLVALRNRLALKKYNFISFKKKKYYRFKFGIPMINFELNNFIEDAQWVIVDFFSLRPRFDFRPRLKNDP
jgi:aminoglycoside N3'-acetyltransferase